MYTLKPKLATYNSDNNINIEYINEMLSIYLEISPYIDDLKYSNEYNTSYNINMILSLLSRVKKVESLLDNKILNFIYCKNRNSVNKMTKFINSLSKGNNYDENLNNFCKIYHKIVDNLSTF